VGQMLAVIRFRVEGDLRYLSHAETMRMFQRALVRAGAKVAYSQGYNPHLRMSLVLPRSVGVESDDEMLCLWLEEGQTAFDVERLKGEMPEGIEIVSAAISQATKVPEPSSARYVIKIRRTEESVKARIEELMTSERLVVERKTGEDSGTKTVDVRPFLESISEEAGDIAVDCKISPAGTIRVGEILGLLQLTAENLAGPVRRTSVQWEGIAV